MVDYNLVFKHLNLHIQAFLVTGGKGRDGSDGYLDLDTTEVYDPSVGTWVEAGAKLPRPMYGLRATNIDDRVLIFGIFFLLYRTKTI